MCVCEDRERKKSWLLRYRRLIGEVESLERMERERLEAAEGLSVRPVTGLPGRKGVSKPDAKVVRHMEAADELGAARAKAESVRRDILGALAAMDDPNQASVLRYRYVNLYDWSKIRDLTHYSISGVYALHRKGIDNLSV